MRMWVCGLAIGGLGCTGATSGKPSDSGVDTGGDTVGDTVDTVDTVDSEPPPEDSAVDSGAPACLGQEDLVPRLEARDSTGTCTVCSPDVTLAVSLHNPCPVDLVVDQYLPTTALARDWELTYPDGTQLASAAYYYGPPVQVVVPAGGSIEQEWEIWTAIGPFDPGTWRAHAWLATVQPFDAGTEFEVK